MPESKMSEEEIDRQYEAYERIPMNTPDAWGDLESFVQANTQHQPAEDGAWDDWLPEGGEVSG